MAIKHKLQSTRADDGDAGDVNPSNWNDEHTADGLVGALLAVGLRGNALPYLDENQVGQLADLTAFARTLLALADAAGILAALGGAPLASPALSGTPTAPTPMLGTATPQIATMAALQAMRDDLINAAPGTLDTLRELATALGNDPNFATTISTALGNRLRVDAAQGLSPTQIAQGVANLALAAVAVSGAYADLTGKPALGTAAALDVGTAANKVVQLDGSARLPALNGSLLTALAWSAITGKPTFGTASGLDVGTTASHVVQLDGSAKLPAVDGSQLTGIELIKASICFGYSGGVLTTKKATNATVVRTSAGVYVVSWTSPPPDANYITVASSQDVGSGVASFAALEAKSAASLTIATFNPSNLALADSADINVIAMW